MTQCPPYSPVHDEEHANNKQQQVQQVVALAVLVGAVQPPHRPPQPQLCLLQRLLLQDRSRIPLRPQRMPTRVLEP